MLNRNTLTILGIAFVLMLLIVQYMRFKRCLNAVYTNFEGYPNLNCGDAIFTVDSFGRESTAYKVSKFPFTAYAATGSIKNKL